LVGVNYQINISDRMACAQPIGESSGWKPPVGDFAAPYREPDGTPMTAGKTAATSS
jgi:hypothetical protein